MILPPTSEIIHHHKGTNITMSPRSLSPGIVVLGFLVFKWTHCISENVILWNISLLRGFSNFYLYLYTLKIAELMLSWCWDLCCFRPNMSFMRVFLSGPVSKKPSCQHIYQHDSAIKLNNRVSQLVEALNLTLTALNL